MALEHGAGKAEESVPWGHSKSRHGPGLPKAAWGHLSRKGSRDVTTACQATPEPEAIAMCVLTFPGDGQDTGRPPAQCPNVQSQPDVIAGGSPHTLCILQLFQPQQAVPGEPAQLACARLTCVTAKREMPCAFCLWLKVLC